MPIPNRIRYFNKRFLNHITIQIAGASHSLVALVEHTGRKSGKLYRTPIMVQPVESGFMFALTYGPAVDWYRNVQAAGRCTLHWKGGKYELAEPQAVTPEAGFQAFPPPQRWVLKAMHIDHFFKMKIESGHS